MLQINKWTLISTIVLLLSACGGSSSSTELTTEEKAIELISEYAQNGGDTPTVQDYIDAEQVLMPIILIKLMRLLQRLPLMMLILWKRFSHSLMI
jgi:hypothetical protein